MLGHLRHELGHYFQPRPRRPGSRLGRAAARCSATSATTTSEALERHYEGGPPADWAERYVSAYATMHPWEDWAETFAHYLHIRDTLQTAAEYGVTVHGPRAVTLDRSLKATPQPEAGERELLRAARELAAAHLRAQRGQPHMGRDDLYPFTLAPPVIDKLSFVHDRVQNARANGPPPAR